MDLFIAGELVVALLSKDQRPGTIVREAVQVRHRFLVSRVGEQGKVELEVVTLLVLNADKGYGMLLTAGKDLVTTAA